MNRIEPKHCSSYDSDFALWSAEQAALIRAGRFDRVDLDNVAEEIESLGRSDKHEIDSRLTIILLHLLKWQYQPDGINNSWAASIVENRSRIARLIEESPSLQAYPSSALPGAYRSAPLAASGETGLPLATFPETCPYTAEQVLDDAFWPGRAPQ